MNAVNLYQLISGSVPHQRFTPIQIIIATNGRNTLVMVKGEEKVKPYYTPGTLKRGPISTLGYRQDREIQIRESKAVKQMHSQMREHRIAEYIFPIHHL